MCCSQPHCTYVCGLTGEAIKRIKCFIPHAEDGLVRGTLRQKGNESGTVKALLEMGFPLKKQNVVILPIHT